MIQSNCRWLSMGSSASHVNRVFLILSFLFVALLAEDPCPSWYNNCLIQPMSSNIIQWFEGYWGDIRMHLWYFEIAGPPGRREDQSECLLSDRGRGMRLGSLEWISILRIVIIIAFSSDNYLFLQRNSRTCNDSPTNTDTAE